MNMTMGCSACGCRYFEVTMNAKELNEFVLVCEECGEPIATINHYSVHWVEDDEDDADSD